MNLLLCKYDNFDNNELSSIINCYQDYFIFKIINNSIYLYLDINVLKYYLTEGFNIKYRKHIFLFLKKTILSINNTSYKISKNLKLKNEYIKIDSNLYKNDELLKDYDIENLKLIINICNKIRLSKNKFHIKDKNIIKLDNDFYANINTGTFLFSKVNNYLFRYNGIILNYNSSKNKLLSLLSLHNLNKKFGNSNYSNYNISLKESVENSLSNSPIKNILKTNCTLILINKNNANSWYFFIKNYLNCNSYYSILSKKNLKYIKNSCIFDLEFLLIDVNFLKSKYFKNYFQKYEILSNKDCINNTIRLSIINSINDNLSNKNIYNESFYNLYIFNWNNIIYDNIEEIINIDKNNYVKYLSTYNTKYYLSENYIEEDTYNYIIDTSIINIDNKLETYYNYTIDISNFYYFVKNELLIKDLNKNIYEYTYIKVKLNNFERELYNYLFSENNEIENNENIDNFNIEIINDKKLKCIQLFLINSNQYCFKEKTLSEIEIINKEHYSNLINNELLNINYKNNNCNNICNNNCNNICNNNCNNNCNNICNNNKITETNSLYETNNEINNYKSKISFFKNTIKTFNEKECYCTVCMDKIINNKITCIITCGHSFCNDCILKYINEKNMENDISYYECPICRTYFTLNMIYSINNFCKKIDNINKTNIGLQYDNSENSSKLEELFNIIQMNDSYINNSKSNNEINSINNKINVKKIIIVTQYKESLYPIKDYIKKHNLENSEDNQICLINLFHNNIITKNRFIEIFNNNNDIYIQNICKYSIIICNYDDIIKYNFKRINQIIFMDQPSNDILMNISEKYLNKYFDKFNFYNSSFKIYFLYSENTVEEKIIKKYINDDINISKEICV